MFLKNFNIFQEIIQTNLQSTSKFVREDNEERNAQTTPFNSINFYVLSSSGQCAPYLVLGGSDVQPVYTDHALGSKSNNFNMQLSSVNISQSNDKVLITMTFVATYTGSNEYTAKEYGIGKRYTSGYNGTETLFYKGLFTEPITFQPNEAKNLVFTIEMS